jgi:hypothetical protein
MKRITQRRVLEPDPKLAPVSDPAAREQTIQWVKRLIWLYFFMLIFEGALRKWFVPALSTPLLLIRDPIVMVIYALTIKAGLWPKNGWMNAIFGLTLLFVPIGLLHIVEGGATPFVFAYGLRTNFMHLPLIFVMREVFDIEDVKRVGKWTLLIALPMAVLMVLQFKSPSSAPINKAIGDGVQLDAVDGKIRPAGTFSFVTGAVDFASMLAAFLFLGAAAKKAYPFWLTLAAGLSLGASLAVSGSRSAVLGAAIVFVMFLVTLACTGRLIGGAIKVVVLAVVAIGLASSTGVVDEGLEVLTKRWKLASDYEAENSGGMSGRVAGDFLVPFEIAGGLPLFGLGIGRGTNVGAQLLGTPGQFLLAEGEWARSVCEAGPILGFAYLGLRLGMALWLGWICFRSALKGNPLPLLLYGAGAKNLVNGQFGPATSLGFAVFVCGLCLAATRLPEEKTETEEETPVEDPRDEAQRRRQSGRRKYQRPRFAPKPSMGGATA